MLNFFFTIANTLTNKTFLLINCLFCRQILDAKYALKRWQIGEIASKIGQLYYHY